MTEEELRDTLRDLFAYDTGRMDSGVWGTNLKARCVEYLASRPDSQELLERISRELWLSPSAASEGYTPEDAAEFLQWIDTFK